MTAGSIDEVLALFERYGPEHYDEELSQLAHAEQTAALAQADGACDALVVAALLHDVGHLLELADRGGPRDRTSDQHHEGRGAAWLGVLFPPTVTSPIALHVRAKRYLCAVDPGYSAALSRGSVASLQRQGGPLTVDQMAAFEANPGGQDAVALRRWDDHAKDLTAHVAPIATYRALMEAVRSR